MCETITAADFVVDIKTISGGGVVWQLLGLPVCDLVKECRPYMTKARGPHVRQRVFKAPFLCIIWQQKVRETSSFVAELLFFFGPTSCLLTVGSHDYDLDLLGYFQS